jgi:hypothetical protein
MTDKPLRAFEDYTWGEYNHTSLAFHRLRWQVKANTTVAESVHVVREVTDAESAQDPFIDADGNLHRVASASLLAEPVSSIQARLDVLNGIDLYGDVVSSGEESDDDVENDDSDWEAPVDGGPWKGPELAVKPLTGAMVTIGDFVIAVHPWLLEKRAEILKETGARYCEDPLPDDTEIWVDVANVSPMRLLNSVHQFATTIEENHRIVAKVASTLLDVEDEAEDEDDERCIVCLDCTLEYANDTT